MAQIARDLRSENRVRLIELLISEGALSKAEISRRTGMSAPTVMRIVDEFLACGLVEEGELAEQPAVGRKPTGISIKSDAVVLAGALHEGQWLQVGLLDLYGHVLFSQQAKAESDLSALITRQVGDLVEQMLRQAGIPGARLGGIGLGLPAVLDPYNNQILTAPLIGLQEECDIDREIRQLSERLHAPVRIENDVNAMAIGEHAGRKMGTQGDLAYIALGTGIGGGLMLRGELRRGANNTAGEIGYMCVSDGDQMDTLESLIGIKGLERRFNLDLSASITEAERERVMDYIVRLLSPCVVNMASVLDLNLITLGGHLVELLGDALIDRLSAQTERLSQLPLRLERGVVPMAGLYGMGMLMQERFLKQLRINGLDTLLTE